jgi:hypothetical protein
MPPKINPLKLNPLQLRTLTILQALAMVQEVASEGPEAGEVTIHRFPQPHLDHFHLGNVVVMRQDATGLYNQKVWHALARKGLMREAMPDGITLTAEGLTYDTGLAAEILHRAGH